MHQLAQLNNADTCPHTVRLTWPSVVLARTGKPETIIAKFIITIQIADHITIRTKIIVSVDFNAEIQTDIQCLVCAAYASTITLNTA